VKMTSSALHFDSYIPADSALMGAPMDRRLAVDDRATIFDHPANARHFLKRSYSVQINLSSLLLSLEWTFDVPLKKCFSRLGYFQKPIFQSAHRTMYCASLWHAWTEDRVYSESEIAGPL
jgi:hypothetical protein